MKRNSQRTQANFKQAKLLLIEDNDDQWLLMQQAMRQELSEVAVQRVATPQQVLHLLEQWDHQEWELPKLIILDLYLPMNTDGLAVLKQFKSQSASIRRIPIIILSHSEMTVDILTAYQLGVASYHPKPLHFAGWLALFREVRTYWWETVTLPPVQYDL
jgi:CheY-like chemotaxis protein